jgi:phosphoribosyl-dephospho-CoA transferase
MRKCYKAKDFYCFKCHKEMKDTYICYFVACDHAIKRSSHISNLIDHAMNAMRIMYTQRSWILCSS